MGKVVKAAAIIAIAAGVALGAPALAGLIVAKGTAAFTALSASFAVGASLAAAAISKALVGSPTTSALELECEGAADEKTPLLRGKQRTQAQPRTMNGFGWDYPSMPPVARMEARQPLWWRDPNFYPWERYAIVRLSGDCLRPSVPDNSWSVIDRYASISRGDHFIFGIDDLRDFLRRAGQRKLRASGLGKLFIGIDPVRQVMVFECTFPPTRMESGMDRVLWAHRVVSIHDTAATARRACRDLRRSARTFGSQSGSQ